MGPEIESCWVLRTIRARSVDAGSRAIGAGQRFEPARRLSFLPISKPNTRGRGHRRVVGKVLTTSHSCITEEVERE